MVVGGCGQAEEDRAAAEERRAAESARSQVASPPPHPGDPFPFRAHTDTLLDHPPPTAHARPRTALHTLRFAAAEAHAARAPRARDSS